jgi:5-oxoprolinase (ATP-hydrolysing)
MNQTVAKSWQFWLDRGGTFTDIVALTPNGDIVTHKLLSENPERYQDAGIQGIRDILQLSPDQSIPTSQIEVIKMGTTVATNALLERKGDRLVLVITKGFKDALRIGYQNRPDIFAREIILPEMLYEQVIEVDERYSADGKELIPVNLSQVESDLQMAYNSEIRSCAIVLLHGYRYHHHELQVQQIAQKIGFTQISVSHQVSPLMKLVSRGDTTVVDAYLSPILRRYVNQIKSELRTQNSELRTQNSELSSINNQLSVIQKNVQSIINHQHYSPVTTPYSPKKPVKLMFMQSNGGLVDANSFQGKDSILSGPAGGIVGAVKTSQLGGFEKIISFDMGGTSTDVAHFTGEYERSFDTEIAGVRFRSPMMSIYTVAAGGGSICQFDGTKYRVGPESAGANPGPASYGKGGPLTITDCNVMVGKIQPDFFPKVFGKSANSPLDTTIVQEKFTQLTQQINDHRTPEQIAAGFLMIAVNKMANAIKKISLQRGYDVSEYTLCCFGGAGGQHACLIADALGIKQIFIHPYAGVLSAYGIGLAEIRIVKEQAIEKQLKSDLLTELEQIFTNLANKCKEDLSSQQATENNQIQLSKKVYVKYHGTDSTLMVNFANLESIIEQFNQLHQQRYGFTMVDKQLIVEQVSLELICPTYIPKEKRINRTTEHHLQSISKVNIFTNNNWYQAPVFQRENLQPGDIILSPALIIESTGTNVIEPGWRAEVNQFNHLILTKDIQQSTQDNSETNHHGITTQSTTKKKDPVLLEIFNNLFRFIAEQMGTTLQNTSYSVNIKERLDFSCAIFDHNGELVANAPHIPVHLGSMSESVQSLIKDKGNQLKKGDVYISNNPDNGGTHLPDITVINPVFINNNAQADFYVASRGHHADIGGITPGSMPPHSVNIEEEGVLIDNFLLVNEGKFREKELKNLLLNNAYPVRNYQQNLGDLQAQIAANEKGVQELKSMVNHYGLETVKAYMGYVQENAEDCVRKVIDVLKNGSFTCELDNGAKITVTITIDKTNHSAKIDFTGTSPQLTNNFNAPKAVCKAAVLYVFRTLVDDDIPLNAGCLKPLEIIIPEGSMLNPKYPAAVVAGNVETSQYITNCIYGALGIMAGSQGTMNNFTFGNEKYQYYETICGGSGAGFNYHGTDAVHTHMTNSRLTDPEVLEWRFPVRLDSFSIRENSGGKGKYKGGNGVIRKIHFLEPMTAGILSSNRVKSPFGLEGGEDGKKGENYIYKKDGTKQQLTSTETIEIQSGDIFIIETPGGGGYGIKT